jgi:hypothetical protein
MCVSEQTLCAAGSSIGMHVSQTAQAHIALHEEDSMEAEALTQYNDD